MRPKTTTKKLPALENALNGNAAGNADIQKRHLEIINETAMATAGIVDVESISQLISKALVDTLGYKISVFQILEQDNLLHFKNVSTPGIILNLLKKALGVSIYDLELPVAKRENYLIRAFAEKKCIEDRDLHKFSRPYVSARAASIMQKIMRLQSMIAVPLIINNKPIGVLSVGSSKKLAGFEIEFLKTFANQIAIALYNAKLLDEQKAQYAELQGAYKKLEELHQLQSMDRAKSEFIRVVSHQFRTPLSGIRFEAEYILEKKKRGDLTENEATDALILIYDRILSLINTLNDIFDALEIDQSEAKIKKEETLFEEAVRDAESIVRQPFVYAQNQKKLIIDIKRAKTPVLIDREKIKRILTILLTNAFIFTENDGTIKLAASVKGRGKKRVLNIIVADNGIGIPANEREKVFEKFYRASNASRAVPNGTGLGLFIVKTFVQMHGGDIAIKDANGKGAIFDISLPV